MLKKIFLKDEEFYRKNILVEFKKINLFTGVNGSGKTKLIRIIQQCIHHNIRNREKIHSSVEFDHIDNIRDNNFFTYLDENRGITSIDTSIDRGTVPLLQHVLNSPTALLIYEEESVFSEFNKILLELFNRKARRNPRMGYGITTYYEKNNYMVDYRNDGRGILNVIIIIMALLTKPPNTILAIEEPSLGLWPSKTYELIKIICNLALKKNITLILTTQDVVVSALFFNEIGNELVQIHKFEDNDGILNIFPVDKDNVRSALDDFFKFSNFQSDFKIFD